MKKAMKLVWMVLFALPLISLTACGDDDEDIVPFKEYGYLIDKTRADVIKDLPFNVTSEDVLGLYYENINSDNVSDLGVFFSFDVEDDKGATITYDKAVWVDEYLYGVTYQTVYNHLEKQYGAAKLQTVYDDNGDVDFTYFQFEKGGKYIWLYEDLSVTYVKKSEWDKLDTRANASSIMKNMKELSRSSR